MTPVLGTRPKDGLRPTTPVSDAGTRMEPPVSVPSAPAIMLLARAAAEPPLDPPATRWRSRGLRVDGVVSP